MRNLKLTIGYDGLLFSGWQALQKGHKSVEGTLKETLEMILQEKITLQAASRTDAGVSAEGQVANFLTQNPLPLKRLQQSLNKLLKGEIAVFAIEEMPLSFHPTLDAQGKEYRYSIFLGEVLPPQLSRTFWHVPYLIDFQALTKAASFLIGRHDFSAFCNAREDLKGKEKVRTLFYITPQLLDDKLLLRIAGDHFLFRQVRNIVGTLVYVARGKIAPEATLEILLSKERRNAAVTAPAHALTLNKIIYRGHGEPTPLDPGFPFPDVRFHTQGGRSLVQVQ